jgi:hypothetical protein
LNDVSFALHVAREERKAEAAEAQRLKLAEQRELYAFDP